MLSRSKHLTAICIGILCLLTLLVLIESRARAAEIYPSSPVTIVCPYAAGGGMDTTLRILGSFLQKDLGQPIVILNKPGASGTVAGLFVSKEKPDGYTLASLDSSGAIPELFTYFRPALYTSKDLTPICQLGTFPFVLAVSEEAPYNTLDEFITYVRKNPKVTIANIGIGHPFHVLTIALERKANIKLDPLPTKGAGECVTLLLGKHVEGVLISSTAAKPHVLAKKFKLLAVEHYERLDWAPTVPTFTQAGYEFGLIPHNVYIFGPKNLPEDVTKTFNKGMEKSLANPEFQKKVEVTGIIVTYDNPSGVREKLEKEKQVTGAFFKELGYIK